MTILKKILRAVVDGFAAYARALGALAILVVSTSALAGPCDTNDMGGCARELEARMNGSMGVTNVRDWSTVSSTASAYWFLTQMHNGFAVYQGNSREHAFLIAVRADTITKPLHKGMTLLDSVSCVKFLGETDMDDDRGFNVKVRLFKQVACE